MTFHCNLVLAGAGVALVAVVGCEKNNKPEEMKTTGATQSAAPNNGTGLTSPIDMSAHVAPNANTPDPNQSTIQRIDQARCEREMACGKIGEGKHWSDDTACRNDLGKDTYEQLKQSDCKTFDQTKLQSCLMAMRTENCDNVQSGLSRIEACRRDVVCKD